MRRIGFLLLLALLLKSCEEEKAEISFNVKTDGITLKDDPDYPEPAQLEFKHSYSAGLISFTQGKQSYSFYVGEGKIDDYLFKLPPGEYIIGSDIPSASLYGQTSGSFLIEPDTVTITDLTDTIMIHLEANCSLILVSDEREQLDDGSIIMQWHYYGYVKAHPMTRDSTSGLYYAYFTPDTSMNDRSAFLWFYGSKPDVKEEGISTSRFKSGYQYYISILE